MSYLTIPEYALLYRISAGYIKKLCEAGKLEGAVRFGRVWIIPDTTKLTDKLYKFSKRKGSRVRR